MAFDTGEGQNRARFDITEAQLEELAGFEEDNWPLKPDEKIIEHPRQGEPYAD